MDIISAKKRPTVSGNPEYFTGIVYQDPIIQTSDPARARAVCVTFLPGGRTNWHTHPLGQTLFVTYGVGRVQKEGEPIREIRPGDTVYIHPGEVHWHGAAPDQMMIHVAMQEALDGIHIDWMGPVSDEDYFAEPERLAE